MTDQNATSKVKEIIATTAVQEKANTWKSKAKPSRRQNGFILYELICQNCDNKSQSSGNGGFVTAFL